MRMIHRVLREDNAAPADATSEGQLLIRLFPDRVEILPLLNRRQAGQSYARLQDLASDWAESPELLAAICEVEPPNPPRLKSWAMKFDQLRHSWN
jgi:hypothetical protein